MDTTEFVIRIESRTRPDGKFSVTSPNLPTIQLIVDKQAEIKDRVISMVREYLSHNGREVTEVREVDDATTLFNGVAFDNQQQLFNLIARVA